MAFSEVVRTYGRDDLKTSKLTMSQVFLSLFIIQTGNQTTAGATRQVVTACSRHLRC